MVILEVKIVVLYQFNVGVFQYYLRLYDMAEQSQQMYCFLKYDRLYLSIWKFTNQPQNSIFKTKRDNLLYPTTSFCFRDNSVSVSNIDGQHGI
jgi:hypothetical protein